MEPEILAYKWKISKGDDKSRTWISTVHYKESRYSFGVKENSTTLHGLFKMDYAKQSWIKMPSKGTPPPILNYGSESVVYKSSMFVFGGNESQLTNDLFEYQFESNTWRQWVIEGDLPDPRYMPYVFVNNDQLWIYGGKNGIKDFNDMWRISLIEGENHKWEKVTPNGSPPPIIDLLHTRLLCVNGNLFILTMVEDNMTKLFNFNFQNLTWSWLADSLEMDRPVLIYKRDHRLFIFNEEYRLFSYDLNIQILSVHKPALNVDLEPATVLNDYNLYYEYNTGEKYGIKIVLNYSKCTLLDDFGNMLNNKLFADVDFLVGELEIPANIAILAARSKWISDRIRHVRGANSTDHSGNIKVKIPDLTPEVFEIVLNYIYTDQIESRQSAEKYNILLILDVYQFALQIHLNNLQQFIIKKLSQSYLESEIETSNVVEVLLKVHNLTLTAVTEHCLSLIAKNLNEETLENKDLEKLDSKLLLEILKRKCISNYVIPRTAPIRKRGTSLEEDMKKFLESNGNEFSDVTLLLGEHRIPAHKCILATRCSYFLALFRSFMPTDNTVRVQIGEIVPSKAAFDSLLKYIYYGEVNLPLEHLCETFSAPAFYGFTNSRLLEIFKEQLNRNNTLEIMIQLLDSAHRANEIEWKKYVLNLIVNSHSNEFATWPRTLPSSPALFMEVIDAFFAKSASRSIT